MGRSEVRDSVHGLIKLSESEWKVVDSPAFQRLRGVQQLAMTHLVYPGARHTRFEHCIGASHIAGRLAAGIGLDKESQDRVRAAALCHDVGHGPFSHVSEFVFEARTGTERVHERISAAIVRHHEPIRTALGAETSDWVADLLSGEGHGKQRTAERDIIAGPADIDKLDYLLRDSRYCGVQYGNYDLDKVVESARLVKKPEGQYLAYHHDGIYAVEGMLLARHHMHRQVYGHKTRVATDRMLVRALDSGVDEHLLPKSVFAPTKLDAAFVEEYLTWDDARVTAVLSASEGKAGDIMRALTSRTLMKRIARFSMQDLLDAGVERLTAGYALEPGKTLPPESTQTAEAAIASAAGVDPQWVVLHWEELQNPISRKDSARILDKEVFVTDDKAKTLESFTERSELFGQAGSSPERYVSVYVRPAPGTPPLAGKAHKDLTKVAIAAIADIGTASRAI